MPQNKFVKSLLFSAVVVFLSNILSYPQISAEKYDKVVKFCSQKLLTCINEIPEGKYPIRTKGQGEWKLTEPSEWTSGFFPGCLWLINELDPNEKY
jgi:unsaturated chondroitin disaccharide hydrolase